MTCDNFVSFNYEKLGKVLYQLSEIDPDLLEQLHYYYIQQVRKNYSENQFLDFSMLTKNLNLDEKKKELEEEILYQKVTPLRLAMSNNRSIKIIL